MELEIRPDPPDEVRRAIAIALASSRDGEPESAWWRAGVEESPAAEEV